MFWPGCLRFYLVQSFMSFWDFHSQPISYVFVSVLKKIRTLSFGSFGLMSLP